MGITSQETEKAKELVKQFMVYANGSVSTPLGFSWQKAVLLENAKKSALNCVLEIQKALQITTGHCELRTLDRQEVQSDFDFWNGVKKAIENLTSLKE